ncbi:MAG TPA: aldo/keto reductase [Thermoleophilaceae bacterium]
MTETRDTKPAQAAGTFRLGDATVYRLGFGAMRITGKGIWGEPPDREEARRVVRRAVELGVNLIDTADSYGPEVSEEILAEALHPYPEGLVIATKGGFLRPGPGNWVPDCSPEHLREACDSSLRRLRLEQIALYQLHTVDSKVPYEESIGALKELQDEGKIRHIGVSNVNVDQLHTAQEIVEVVSVQNRYNVTDRRAEDVLDDCERQGIGFIPWWPLAVGELARPGGALDEVAREVGGTPSQVAIAWLLRRSPVMLPIPGTGSVQHLEENLEAARIELSEPQFDRIAEAAG